MSEYSALDETVVYIERMLERQCFDELDKGINEIDITHCRPEMMVAILKTTSPYKKQLTSWYPFIVRARRELIYRGIDSENMLRGM